MIYLKLLEIAIIITIIIDISGVIDSIKEFIGKKLNITNVRLKPLDCSLCMNFWISLVYLICVGELGLTTVMATLLLCTMTPVIGDLIYLIRDICGFFINKISRILK